MSAIQILDGRQWAYGSAVDRREFAKSLRYALATSGFVKLVNHGISDEGVDGIFESSKTFFDLPVSEKQTAANTPGVNQQRGWSRLGEEKTSTLKKHGAGSQAELKDAKEHFDCGSAEDEMFPNVWPTTPGLDSFRPTVQTYYDQCQQIALALIEALEVGFDLAPGSLSHAIRERTSDLRLSHYPAVPVDDLKDGSTNRIWPHTDLGIITLLLQDTVGGLEVWDHINDSGYVPVVPRSRYEMIINVGDTLQRWTNGNLRAGLHRVTTPQTVADTGTVSERFSIGFFLKPSREQGVGAMPVFVDGDHPSRYDDISMLELQELRNSQLY
ncbi:putative gibberellin 20-oxidase [Aspergillus karnatakaensis]|uniref:isopenicillin N synthase family dioxygenase n=1 Tax=Aspergillus karnatakaensis TaxID=1810916 RepID=UPI003CCE2EE9